MAPDPRRTALLAVGIALLTTPIWAPTLDVTGRDYEYRAAPVTVDDDRIRVAGDHPRLAGFEGVDCFREVVPSRRCGFESELVDGTTVRADYPGVRHVTGDPSLDAPERYVAFAGDGRVFRRTTGWNDSAGVYRLGLARVNASRALDEVARPAGQHSRAVRRAAERGTARADEPLPEPVLVTTDDGYRLVYSAGTRTFLSEKPVTERLFELVAVGSGALLCRRIWRD